MCPSWLTRWSPASGRPQPPPPGSWTPPPPPCTWSTSRTPQLGDIPANNLPDQSFPSTSMSQVTTLFFHIGPQIISLHRPDATRPKSRSPVLYSLPSAGNRPHFYEAHFFHGVWLQERQELVLPCRPAAPGIDVSYFKSPPAPTNLQVDFFLVKTPAVQSTY